MEEVKEIEKYRGYDIRKVQVSYFVYSAYKDGKPIATYCGNMCLCQKQVDEHIEFLEETKSA